MLFRLRFESCSMHVSGAFAREETDALNAQTDAAFFSQARVDFVSCLPGDGQTRVLEIGCGIGATGALAKHQKRAEYYAGVEPVPSAADVARAVLDEVIVGDVETLQFDWLPAAFDALFLSDVLETMRDPDAVFEKLNRFLRPGALVLASSPNVAYWRSISQLAGGSLPMGGAGGIGMGPRSWFTPHSYCSLFERNGLAVAWAGPVTPLSWQVRMLSRMTAGRYDHLFIPKICVVASKRG